MEYQEVITELLTDMKMLARLSSDLSGFLTSLFHLQV